MKSFVAPAAAAGLALAVVSSAREPIVAAECNAPGVKECTLPTMLPTDSPEMEPADQVVERSVSAQQPPPPPAVPPRAADWYSWGNSSEERWEGWYEAVNQTLPQHRIAALLASQEDSVPTD